LRSFKRLVFCPRTHFFSTMLAISSRVVLFVWMLFLCANAQWAGVGSYTRADIVDPLTIYNSERCNQLLPETLELIFLGYDSGDFYGYGAGYYTEISLRLSIGQETFTTISSNSVDRFTDRFSLTNGKTAQGGVYILYDGISSFLIHIFLDTTSFRSADPSSADFVEKEICQIVYAQDEFEDKQAEAPQVLKQYSRHERAGECDFLADANQYVSLEEAKSCLRSVPFSSSIRDGVVDSLRDVMAFYVYKDINSDVSYGDDKISLDIMAEIDRISQENYDGDLAFHIDLVKTFAAMRDVHTQWVYPQCYRGFQFIQPFRLSSYATQQGKQEIVISDGNRPEVFLDALNINVDAYTGWIVKKINNQNALEHLIEFADAEIGYKSRSSRFAQILKSYTSRVSIRIQIPEGAITWELESPITKEIVVITFDWLVLIPQNGIATNTNEFAEWCLSNDLSFACGFADKDIRVGHTTANLLTPVYGAQGFKIVPVNSQVGAIVIPTFAPAEGYFWEFTMFSVLYLTSIHTYNFDRVIVDVSDNGGGFGYSANFLGGLFVPAFQDTKLFSNGDQIENSLYTATMDYIYRSGNDTLRDSVLASRPNALVTGILPEENQLDPEASWYFPGVKLTRGGHKSTYTSLQESSLGEDQYVNSYLQKVHSGAEYYSYNPEDLEILTNGICFSSCAIFIRIVRFAGEDNAPDVIGWGGIIGEPLDASQVPASVLNLKVFSQIFSEYTWIPDYPVDEIPQAFPFVSYVECSGSYFQIAYFELYENDASQKNSLPMEFIPNPVDCRLNVWSRGIELYSQAAYAFYDCPNSDFQSVSDIVDNDSSSNGSLMILNVVLLLVFLCLI